MMSSSEPGICECHASTALVAATCRCHESIGDFEYGITGY